MNNKVLSVFAVIGIMFTVLVIEEILSNLWGKFKRWRINGCKIKCLCKPHKYELVWYWRDTEEAVLECKKCGKRKQVFIDYNSIKEKIH